MKLEQNKTTFGEWISLLAIIVAIVAIVMAALSMPPQADPPQAPAILFTPDTVRIEVQGQVFQWGQLTIFSDDTVSLGVFVHESMIQGAK